MTSPRLTGGPLDVCGLDPHEVRQLVYDHLALQAVFVHALDAAPLPVRPVDVVSQQREAKDVRQVLVHQHPPTRSVHLHHLQNTTHTPLSLSLYISIYIVCVKHSSLSPVGRSVKLRVGNSNREGRGLGKSHTPF